MSAGGKTYGKGSGGLLGSERGAYLGAGVIAMLFGAFFFYPLFLAIRTGFIHNGSFSLYWIGRVLENQTLTGKLFNSFVLACCTTLAVTVITIPLATVGARYEFAGRGVLSTLLLVPMILPPFVGALSIKRFLGQFGTLNIILERIGVLDMSEGLPPDWLGSGFGVVVLLQALHLFPIMYLNLSSALSNIDPAYMEASRTFGAGGFSTFRRITLPLVRPGLFAGGSIVFIWSFTDIGTPLIVGYENLASVTVFKELSRADISGRTYGLVFLLLVFSILFYTIGKVVFGRPVSGESSKATVMAESKKLSPVSSVFVWLMFGTVIFLAVLPHIGVVLTAFSRTWMTTILPESYTLRHINYVLTRPETRTSIFNSIKYAGASTLLDIIIGSAAAWIIIRKRPKGARVLDSMLMLPLAVPGLIIAAGFIAMTVKGSPLEKIGPLGNPFLIIVIAYAVRRIPFILRGVSAGLEQIPETLEQAARNLGASPGRALFRITVPLISANIIASSVLTFAFAMLEVSDSLMLAQLRKHYPITKEIYSQAVSANTDAANIAAALGVIGMLLLGGSLALAVILLGKKLGAIFRA